MSTQLDLVPVKPTTAIVGDADTATARRQGRSKWFRLLVNDRVAAVAAAVLGLVFLTAIFGPMLVGDLATHIDLDNSNQAPFTLAHGWANVLGTDPLGRSMLARLIVACRTTLSVAIPAVVISAVVGSAHRHVGRLLPRLARDRRHAGRRRDHELPVAAAGGRRALRVLAQRREHRSGAGDHPHPGLPAHRPRRVRRAAEPAVRRRRPHLRRQRDARSSRATSCRSCCRRC